MASRNICSLGGCDRPAKAAGLCWAHYKRDRKARGPLPGRARIGDALRWLEENLDVATEGCLDWPFSRLTNGYAVVRYQGRPRSVSRIVCERVNGPPPEPWYEAAHECGRGHEGCVNHRHLAWKTPTDNRGDKLRHGTHLSGARHPAARLTQEQAAEILSLKGRVKQSALAEKYGVSTPVICRIQSGMSYR